MCTVQYIFTVLNSSCNKTRLRGKLCFESIPPGRITPASFPVIVPD